MDDEDDDGESGGPPGAPVAILRGVVGGWCGSGSRLYGLLVEGWFSWSSQLTCSPVVCLGTVGVIGVLGFGLWRARTSSAPATGGTVLCIEPRLLPSTGRCLASPWTLASHSRTAH